MTFVSSSWTSVQHVLSNSRPDWNDWGGAWSHGCYEHSHTLQSGDATDASAQLPRPDQWPCCRYCAPSCGLHFIDHCPAFSCIAYSDDKMRLKYSASDCWSCFIRPWSHEGKAWAWRAPEGSTCIRKPGQRSGPERKQPGQSGWGLPVLLAGTADTRLHLHESALSDEPAWPFPGRAFPGSSQLDTPMSLFATSTFAATAVDPTRK